MNHDSFKLLEIIGAPIFPLAKGTKKPLENSNGFHGANKNYDPKIYEHHNVGIRLGDGLAVMDLDPRAFTDESRAFVAEIDKHMPSTIMVHTVSDGGSHRYYHVDPDEELKSFDYLPGVQILFDGKYVVAAGSFYRETNKHYEADRDDYSADDIEMMPGFIYEAYTNYRTAKNIKDRQISLEIVGDDAPANMEELSIATHVLNPNMPYAEWVSIGMALKSTGDPKAFDIFDDWSSTGDNYKEGECLKKWNSFKSGGYSYRSIFHKANEVYPDWMALVPVDEAYEAFSKMIDGWVLKEKEKLNDVYFTAPSEAIIDPSSKERCNPDPLPRFPEVAPQFKELVEHIYHSAPNKMPYFSIATALAKISYLSTNVKSFTNTPMNLFQICHMKSGGGKGYYTAQAQKDGVISYAPGSGGGIFESLQVHKNQLFISPEIGKFLLGLQGHKPSNPQSDSIQESMLQAYAQEPLNFVATKANIIRAKANNDSMLPITDYSFGVFGTGTTNVIQGFINDAAMRETGFVNRFLFYGDEGYMPTDLEMNRSDKKYPDHWHTFMELMRDDDKPMRIKGEPEWFNEVIYLEYRKQIGVVKDDTVKKNLLMRTVENAIRIASLIDTYEKALRRNWSSPIDREIVRWGWQLSLHCAHESFKLIDDARKAQAAMKNTDPKDQYSNWLTQLQKAVGKSTDGWVNSGRLRGRNDKAQWVDFIKWGQDTGVIVRDGKNGKGVNIGFHQLQQ